MEMTPDRKKMKAAASEIRAVLRAYDLAGIVVMASGDGHSEYVNEISNPFPTWSCIYNDGANRVRIRALAKSAPEDARAEEKRKQDMTVNMVMNLRDVLKFCYDNVQRLSAMLHQHLPIDEEDGRWQHDS